MHSRMSFFCHFRRDIEPLDFLQITWPCVCACVCVRVWVCVIQLIYWSRVSVFCHLGCDIEALESPTGELLRCWPHTRAATSVITIITHPPPSSFKLLHLYWHQLCLENHCTNLVSPDVKSNEIKFATFIKHIHFLYNLYNKSQFFPFYHQLKEFNGFKWNSASITPLKWV